VFLLLLVVVGLAQGAFFKPDLSHRLRFSTWMRAHQKVYTSEEFKLRYDIFKDNADFVETWNANPENSHKVELNHLADLSNEEYQQILGTHFEAASTPLFVPASIEAVSLNWADKGVVTPIKDQGQCGSCFAFSSTGSIEGAYALKTGKLVSLSEQNIMDCSLSMGNMGCGGGLMDTSFRWVIKNQGIDTENSYPYEAKNGASCLFSAANVGATISSFVDITSGSEAALLTAVKQQPVSVAIDASKKSFQLYSSGVYYESTCSSSRLDHGVLAVGYGTDNTTQAFWIVKNSWGEKWGNSGYLWMSMNRDNNCGIATMASYPVA